MCECVNLCVSVLRNVCLCACVCAARAGRLQLQSHVGLRNAFTYLGELAKSLILALCGLVGIRLPPGPNPKAPSIDVVWPELVAKRPVEVSLSVLQELYEAKGLRNSLAHGLPGGEPRVWFRAASDGVPNLQLVASAVAGDVGSLKTLCGTDIPPFRVISWERWAALDVAIRVEEERRVGDGAAEAK